MVRNDRPCGTTIGPLISERIGILTVDIGIPLMAMHSIRETAGVLDCVHLVDLMKSFFEVELKKYYKKIK